MKFHTILKFFGVLLCVAIVVGARYQYLASKKDEQALQPVGRMIDVGGYKLHMIDSQVGPQTVILDADMGKNTLDWCLVQPELAKYARVITYDRAGYGWSDVSRLPRTCENIAEELHTLLHRAQVPAPYILVGDGFGAINMQLFACRYPDEVAALILVDNAMQDVPVWQKYSALLYLVDVANSCGLIRIAHMIPMVAEYVTNRIAAYPHYLQNMYIPLILTTKYMHAMIQECLYLLQRYNMKNCNIDSKIIQKKLSSNQSPVMIHAVQEVIEQLQK